MPDQSAGNVIAAVKREVTMGTAAASGAGATMMRLLDSPGMRYERGQVASGERRRDQQTNLPRLAGHDAAGTFNKEVTIGGANDMFIEALCRQAWSAALVDAAVANVTTTTNTVVRAAGSWITTGFKEGDVITLTGDSTTANNNLRSMVLSVTATVITVMGTPFTLNAVGRAVTVTRLKKVISPVGSAVTLVQYSHTIEQYEGDADDGELFTGCRVTSGAFSLRPRAMSTVAWGLMGLTRTVPGPGASPYFTSPSLTTGDPVIADDAYIFYKGAQVTKITGLDITAAIRAATTPTIGNLISADVFMNQLQLTGTITAIRDSMAALTDFDAETEFAIGAILREPQGTPRPAMGIYIPKAKILGIDAPFLGGDAAKIESRELAFGPHAGDTDTDAASIIFYSSAA